MFLLLLLLALENTVHPLSFARMEIKASENEVSFELRIQDLTVADTVNWELDTDGDGSPSRTETDAILDPFLDYLATDLWFEIDGEVWRPSPAFLSYEDSLEGLGITSDRYDHLVVTGSFHLSKPIQQLTVHSDLFYERGNPTHRMHVQVDGLCAEPDGLQYLMSSKEREAVFQTTIPVNSAPPGLIEAEKSFYFYLKNLALLLLIGVALIVARGFSSTVLAWVMLLAGIAIGWILPLLGTRFEDANSESLTLALLGLTAATGLRLDTQARMTATLAWNLLLFLGALLLGALLGQEATYPKEEGFALFLVVGLYLAAGTLSFALLVKLGKLGNQALLLISSALAACGFWLFGTHAQNLVLTPLPQLFAPLLFSGLAALVLMRLPGKGEVHSLGRQRIQLGFSLWIAWTAGQLLGTFSS